MVKRPTSKVKMKLVGIEKLELEARYEIIHKIIARESESDHADFSDLIIGADWRKIKTVGDVYLKIMNASADDGLFVEVDGTNYTGMVPPKSTIAEPPRLAELTFFICAGEHAEAEVGDAFETFDRNCREHGVDRARRLFWYDALASLRPRVWKWLKTFSLGALFGKIGW